MDSDLQLLVAQKAKTSVMLERYSKLARWQDKYILLKSYRDSLSEEFKAAHERTFHNSSAWDQLDTTLSYLEQKIEAENEMNYGWLKPILSRIGMMSF